MRLHYSQLPGRHERHLLRKQNNPLFPEPQRIISQDDLTEAQRLDHEELERYIQSLRKLVGEAVSLGPHEQSDVILELKERLDHSYETACRLADDQSPNKEAIRKLVEVIMRAVWKGAGNDTLAHQELEQEEMARATHYDLLETPLVADLLDPESLIKGDELLLVLLSEKREDFEAAITLFDSAQLRLLCEQGVELRRRDESLESLPDARGRLDELERRLTAIGDNS
jgi:hypothetical protein